MLKLQEYELTGEKKKKSNIKSFKVNRQYQSQPADTIIGVATVSLSPPHYPLYPW